MPEEEKKPKVDTQPFRRGRGASIAGGRGRFTRQLELHALAQVGYGLDPRGVPVAALQLMGATCPGVYLAERTISGIVRRPDLFSVDHSDPKIKAETEAWLWAPALLPRLLAGAARGYGYGTVACILDWQRKTLRIEVENEDGKTRNKTLVEHTHFARAFEVHPDATSFQLDEQGEIVAVDVLGTSYPASRAAPFIWDPEFGDVVGQGARQRAWRAYCQYLIVSLLRDKYLERSVDAPRIAYAPSGKVMIGGVPVEIPEHVVQLLQDLQGSGVAAFPAAYDANGHRKYEVQPLNLPDRARVWDDALDRAEAEVFKAYLVPPTMAGAIDADGAATKALEGMLREYIEDLATFAAAGLTRLVHIVHAANYDPEKVPPPDIIATDVGKVAARKTFMEVLRLANQASRGEIAMRSDVPKMLDDMGIPVRKPPIDPFEEPEEPEEPAAGDDDEKSGEEPEEPEEPAAGDDDEKSGEEPGRPRDPFGERERRREDATTSEGEDDTGGDDVEREER